jgi:hypothetical protein
MNGRTTFRRQAISFLTHRMDELFHSSNSLDKPEQTSESFSLLPDQRLFEALRADTLPGRISLHPPSPHSRNPGLPTPPIIPAWALPIIAGLASPPHHCRPLNSGMTSVQEAYPGWKNRTETYSALKGKRQIKGWKEKARLRVERTVNTRYYVLRIPGFNDFKEPPRRPYIWVYER